MRVQPRYEAYCRAHGNTPEEQTEADRKRWPGGAGCGFMIWIGERLHEFIDECRPEYRRGAWRPDYDVYRLRSDRDQRDFTQWLLDRAPARNQ